MAGLLYAFIHQDFTAPKGMGSDDIILRATLQGEIVSIPITRFQTTQFDFLVHHFNGQPVSARIRLSCYESCPVFHAGDAWELMAKLKKPRNYRNIGGFDFAASMTSRHLSWTGYTLRGTYHLLPLNPSVMARLLQYRVYLGDQLQRFMKDPVGLGILQALTLGETHHISSDMWDLFRRTGTTHLMVISGAHIGLVAGLIFSLLRWVWCHLGRLTVFIPAARVASFFGIAAGFLYALFAGFGVPAQRSVIAFSILSVRYLTHCRFTAWQAWQYALLFVLILEPHAVLQPGFYLSFIAVAILIFMNQYITLSSFKKMVCLQLSCLIGLMPWTLFWFSYASINGFFANLLAIPWVSIVMIPLGLIITYLGPWLPLSGLIQIAHFSTDALMTYLHWIDAFSSFNITVTLTSFFCVVLMMCAGLIGLIMPLKSWCWVLLLLLISSFLPKRTSFNTGDFTADILDVGQGLAVVIRTRHHVLIYDTGMQFYHGSDMGKMVILPYLQSQHLTQIDTIVISHPDLDHRGGLASLEKVFSHHELLVDDPGYYPHAKSCHDYPDWTWDGVSFHFFAIKADFSGKNNRSCVLQISNHAGQLLLTGDIERAAEAALVNQYGSLLHSSVMLIPHHGSKTSSTKQFVDAVNPDYAVVSYGFDNRYHFPHQQALSVYQTKHIPVRSTMVCGMIRLIYQSRKTMPQLLCPSIYCARSQS